MFVMYIIDPLLLPNDGDFRMLSTLVFFSLKSASGDFLKIEGNLKCNKLLYV